MYYIYLKRNLYIVTAWKPTYTGVKLEYGISTGLGNTEVIEKLIFSAL